MPRIPIIPPRDGGAGGAGGGPGNGPEALPPEQANALRALEDRTARIDRELAVAQSWRAAVDRLVEAEDAEDGPPPGFTRSFLDEADKERAGLLKTVPLQRQDDLEQDLSSLRSVFADRAAAAEASGLALRRRSGLYRALDEYRQGVTRDPGLYDEAVLRLEGLSGDLGLPDDRLTAMRHELRDALGNAAVDGLMTNPERAARGLSDGLFDDALSEGSKARRLSEAQTAAARKTLYSREKAVSDLTAQARQGTAPDEAILTAEQEGVLAPAKAAKLREANAQAAARGATREARIQRVTMLTEPLDPSNPEDRATASDYWDSVAEVYASDDAEEQRANELTFIERLGVLPDGLARKYQGALLSTDPTLAVSGATALAALQKTNPALVAGIPSARMRKATAISEFAVLDLPPERAIELAEEELESITGTPETSPEKQVAAAEPPILSDAIESGAPDERTERPAQIAQADKPRQQPPSWEELSDLERELKENGERAFAEAARKAGLDPDRARLFIDMLHARPADHDAVLARIRTLYEPRQAEFLKQHFERFVRFENIGPRKQSIDDQRKSLLADAPEREAQGNQAFEIGGSIVGPPGPKNIRRPVRSRSKNRQQQRLDLEPGPGYRPDRKFISPDDYQKLPEKGVIDPQRIRTSQKGFNEKFSVPYIPSVPESQYINYMAKELRSGKLNPKSVDPIQLVEWKGHIYSLDHRRLIAFRRAGVEVPYEKVRFEDLPKGKQRRIRGAPNRNDNGAFIPNEITKEKE